ncbi:MAG: Gfo/Idh/MocA family oxidoreductase, partial [Candidatus Omnitrophica bacterium]|nr:Gfo/Idh/MocA family oxidoreductase [Candidatus Omnitrophota bacterium]
MNRIRAAVIGTGKIAGLLDRPQKTKKANSYAQAFFNAVDIDLVAVCDKDLGVLSKFANQWKIEAAYTKVTDLLNMERFDVISLCTPTETHFRI